MFANGKVETQLYCCPSLPIAACDRMSQLTHISRSQFLQTLDILHHFCKMSKPADVNIYFLLSTASNSTGPVVTKCNKVALFSSHAKACHVEMLPVKFLMSQYITFSNHYMQHLETCSKKVLTMSLHKNDHIDIPTYVTGN